MLYDDIQNFVPFCEQEESDRRLLLQFMERNDDLLLRENRMAHFTASAWVVSPERSRVLMAYHNIFNSWSWLGGHADGECDLCAVASRELTEESGLARHSLLLPEIFSLEILGVAPHRKNGRYISSHLHLNVTYLFEADDTLPLRCKPDENRAVRWIAPQELARIVSEPLMLTVYDKLTEKVRHL